MTFVIYGSWDFCNVLQKSRRREVVLRSSPNCIILILTDQLVNIVMTGRPISSLPKVMPRKANVRAKSTARIILSTWAKKYSRACGNPDIRLVGGLMHTNMVSPNVFADDMVSLFFSA